jgi:hypothetical protein
MPTSITFIIAAVIGRVGDPANMLIGLVGVVPIRVVIGDRRSFPMSVQVMHPPAFAVRIARDIASIFSLGAGCCGHHCAREYEQRAHCKRSVKLSHVEPFKAANRIRQLSVRNERNRKTMVPAESGRARWNPICQHRRPSHGPPYVNKTWLRLFNSTGNPMSAML